MKFEETTLVRKWREYAGPKDERLEAENAKIYKRGFMALAFGMLAILVYQMMAQQVAWVHNAGDAPYDIFENPIEALLYAWLCIVAVACSAMQTRKGYVETNRFGEPEKFPLGYFSLVAGISGIVSALAIAAMRCIAELFIVPFEEVYWGANLACGLVFGVVIFAATLLAFYLAFASAKRNRKRIQAELDD